MYVFVKKVLKYKTGPRLQRRTPCNGFWRATNHQKDIEFAGCLVGHRTNLVYCTGEGRGVQTDWLMYEYKLPDQKAVCVSIVLVLLKFNFKVRRILMF